MKEKRGTIYTIEFDADGNLKRFSSAPAPADHSGSRFSSSLHQKVVLASLIVLAGSLILLALRGRKSDRAEILLIVLALASFLTALIVMNLDAGSRGRWISADDFLNDWIADRKRQKGYKYHDRPGCYVITSYSEKLKNYDHVNDYDSVYVGQSMKVYQRVFNHFTGRGNGKVYTDLRSGKYVYVRIIPCREKKLNEMEKSLIAVYDAQHSYNKTQGGAQKR